MGRPQIFSDMSELGLGERRANLATGLALSSSAIPPVKLALLS
jgi:hypothetical protein